MIKGKSTDVDTCDCLISWIGKRTDEFGITPVALAESIWHDRNYRPLYRDARGNEWNGVGDMPRLAAHCEQRWRQ